jgi:hypothetical protein
LVTFTFPENSFFVVTGSLFLFSSQKKTERKKEQRYEGTTERKDTERKTERKKE